MDVTVRELREDHFRPRDVPDFGLSEPVYAQALDHLVQANVDVIVHTGDGRILLGYRKDLPLRDMFWVFGGRMKVGETMAAAGARALARELGLDADRGRLRFADIYNVMWGNRSAPPEGNGFQTLLTLMTYRCTEEEAECVAVADGTHQSVRWYSTAEIRELRTGDSGLIHPFLPIVLENAGLY
ncbi:NUDIX domain-containing protein [Nonomuraea sp. NBC_01738]|uniref:NUDIX domain-containing protein n=1 Tax=Nonomuraea sp. NBC_01738 TaxID=2976003 RepID=UPI002E10E12C|nr:NUDIX domain-containing protein [Nonomuraea sp. NBC_01738]